MRVPSLFCDQAFVAVSSVVASLFPRDGSLVLAGFFAI